MASVPNMRLGAAAPANGAGVPLDGEAGDLFAQLLSTTSILEGATELSIATESAPTDGAPAAPDDQSAQGEDILLALTTGMAFQPVAVPVAPSGEVPTQPPVAEAPAGVPAGSAPTTITAPEAKIAIPTTSLPQSETPPVQPQTATAPTAKTARPPVAEEPQIEFIQTTPVAGKAFQTTPVAAKALQTKEPAGRLVPPAVREAQAAATAMPVAEAKPARPVERAKPGQVSGLSEKAAVSVPTPPLPFLTPAAMLTAVAPDLAVTPQPSAHEAPQPQDVAQQLIEHELDLAQDGEWLDQLARDIARSGGSEGPMRFRLNPQTLGHLQVEVAQGDKGASIRLTVETEAARTIIADAQPRLMAEARAQGVRVAETHVDLAGARDHAAGDQRRHEDGRQTPTIRTARAPAGEADTSPAERNTGSERYA